MEGNYFRRESSTTVCNEMYHWVILVRTLSVLILFPQFFKVTISWKKGHLGVTLTSQCSPDPTAYTRSFLLGFQDRRVQWRRKRACDVATLPIPSDTSRVHDPSCGPSPFVAPPDVRNPEALLFSQYFCWLPFHLTPKSHSQRGCVRHLWRTPTLPLPRRPGGSLHFYDRDDTEDRTQDTSSRLPL